MPNDYEHMYVSHCRNKYTGSTQLRGGPTFPRLLDCQIFPCLPRGGSSESQPPTTSTISIQLAKGTLPLSQTTLPEANYLACAYMIRGQPLTVGAKSITIPWVFGHESAGHRLSPVYCFSLSIFDVFFFRVTRWFVE